MLLGIRREYTCNTRVKSASKNGCDTCFFKTLSVSPLPLVFKLCSIFRLIVCSIKIISFCFKTSVHDCKILIRESNIYNDVRLFSVYKFNKLGNAVGVNLSRCNFCGSLVLKFLFEFITLGFCTACYAYFSKHFTVLAAFVNYNSCNAAGTNY